MLLFMFQDKKQWFHDYSSSLVVILSTGQSGSETSSCWFCNRKHIELCMVQFIWPSQLALKLASYPHHACLCPTHTLSCVPVTSTSIFVSSIQSCFQRLLNSLCRHCFYQELQPPLVKERLNLCTLKINIPQPIKGFYCMFCTFFLSM